MIRYYRIIFCGLIPLSYLKKCILFPWSHIETRYLLTSEYFSFQILCEKTHRTWLHCRKSKLGSPIQRITRSSGRKKFVRVEQSFPRGRLGSGLPNCCVRGEPDFEKSFKHFSSISEKNCRFRPSENLKTIAGFWERTEHWKKRTFPNFGEFSKISPFFLVSG